jgi:two-component sensor histidine kinase/Tfp pilus assembly protein PilF
MLHNNIGGVLVEQDRWDKALERFRTARAGFMAEGDTLWTVNVLNNIGNIHQERGQHDSSAVIYREAAMALDRIGQRGHAASAWLNLGNALTGLERSEEALEAYEAALERTAHQEDDHSRAMAFLGLARARLALGRVEQARTPLDSGLATAMGLHNAQQIARAHELFATWFERFGSLDSALLHQRLFSQWRDSVFTSDMAGSINELQERYESGKKDLLIQENKAQLEQRALTIKAIAAGAVLLLVSAVFAYRAYRVKRKGEAEVKRQKEVIEAQLKEKELLLREIHHRVKNNLQTVSSLLSIQGRGIADEKAKEAVNDSRLRVKSMALIHQDLYREGDLTGVRMDDYVAKLANGLLTSYAMADRVRLDLRVQPINLDVDTAVPLGLILNELITNALKYAWPDGRHGALAIALREAEDTLELEVADDGVGIADPSAVSAGGTGFGLGMIRTFSSKLKAEHRINGEKGTTVSLVVRNYKRTA